MAADGRGKGWKRLVGVFILMLAASLLARMYPVVTKPIRALDAGTVGLTIVLGAALLARSAIVRPRVGRPTALVAFVLLALTGAWAIRADRPWDRGGLRRQYLTRLQSFEGTRYVWGGERHNGIDCSGLARVALWEAMIRQGLAERNPRLLGPMALRFWWHDMSAYDMMEGSHGYTRVIGKAKRLAGCETSALRPGDLAVASSGVHVLIYLGGGRWIEASPDDGRVVSGMAGSDSKRPWFGQPVVFVRWEFL